VDSHTESYVPSPADRPADGISKVSAPGGALEAPAVAGGFERIWRAYGRYGNKVASRRAFEAIINPDVDHIVSRAAAWAASAKPGQRRMPLERWLQQERYDEADRSVRPRPTAANDNVEDNDMRRKATRDPAEAAEAARAIDRAAIEIDAPRNVPLTVRDATTDKREGDTWLVLNTDGGRVAILLEGNDATKQEAGQAHLGRLADACGVEVEEPADVVGRTFVFDGDTFAAPPMGRVA
jgi:hypothetical protein